MTDLDRLLARLGQLPPDARLAGIDEAVFAGLAAARDPVLPRGALGAVAGLALLLGALAGGLPAAPAGGALPLGVPGELAPSSLLGDGR
ncbi:MAG TPA: hypothetical protein VFF98_09910 [Novosphingobium sp.]|nr:hypothetical protein [Novosphingobium sp.]